MKKLIFLACALLILSGTVLQVFSAENNPSDKLIIDHSKDIKLNFDGYIVKVEGWDKAYAEVKSNLTAKEKKNMMLSVDENEISAIRKNGKGKVGRVSYSILPWFTLMQFPEYQNLFVEDNEFLEYAFVISVDFYCLHENVYFMLN